MKSNIINKIKDNKKKIIIGFVAVATIMAGGGATIAYAHEKDEHQPIEYSAVPAEAKQTLGRYFAGEKIQNVTVEDEHGRKEYEIKLTNGAKMELDDKGNWEKVSVNGTEFPISILPEGVRSYLATNYGTSKIVKAKHGSKGYKVKLDNGIKLKFDNNGNFVKID